MKLVDFRNWEFKISNVLPNAQKALIKKDFDTMQSRTGFDVLKNESNEPLFFSSYYYENEDLLGISSLPKVHDFLNMFSDFIASKEKDIVDYSEAADEKIFFYGSKSLVAHSESEIGVCGVNSLSDESLFEEYCEDFELTPFGFELEEGKFTSDVCLFIGNTLFVCWDYIKDKKEKKQLLSLLKRYNIEVFSINKSQVEKDILNMVFVNRKLWMFKSVFEQFSDEQKKKLERFELEIIEAPFLESERVKLADIIL